MLPRSCETASIGRSDVSIFQVQGGARNEKPSLSGEGFNCFEEGGAFSYAFWGAAAATGAGSVGEGCAAVAPPVGTAFVPVMIRAPRCQVR